MTGWRWGDDSYERKVNYMRKMHGPPMIRRNGHLHLTAWISTEPFDPFRVIDDNRYDRNLHYLIYKWDNFLRNDWVIWG